MDMDRDRQGDSHIERHMDRQIEKMDRQKGGWMHRETNRQRGVCEI